MYTFPPTAPKPESEVNESDPNSDTDKSPMVANILPKGFPSINGAPHSDDKDRPWSLQLQQQQYSPYASLVGTRRNTFSPTLQGDLASKRVSRLPTTTNVNDDMRTINLHLALRAKEIIACSESMWEWVERFQRESATIPTSNDLSNWSLDMTRFTILEMTREDFDHLLNNFTLQVPFLN